MNNKKKILVIGTILTLSLSITGCSKQVSLKDAILKTSLAESKSYSIELQADVEQDIQAKLSGDIKQSNDEVLMTANLALKAEGVSIETPITMKTQNEKFEIFMGTNTLKAFIPETNMFGDAKYLYLSYDDMIKFLEENNVDETDMLKNNDTEKTEKLSENLLETFMTYIDNDNITKFERIEDFSISKNGKYTVTLTKDDIKNIMREFVSNDENYTLLNELNSNELGSKEEVLNLIDETVASAEFPTTTLEFTITDGYLSQIIATISVDETPVSIKISYFNFNTIDEIIVPDKNSDEVLNVMNLYKDLMNGLIDTSDMYGDDMYSDDLYNDDIYIDIGDGHLN